MIGAKQCTPNGVSLNISQIIILCCKLSKDIRQITVIINTAKVYIEETKTNAGTRVLPLSDDVYDCFKRILAKRNPPKIEPVIDGYSGFLFFDKERKPMVAMHWEKYFQHAVDKYNRTYKVQIPKITPHVCRHTYCSNMAKSGMNPKTLQYLMGHSDIGVTLNTYTHLKLEDAQKEVNKIVSINAKKEQKEA